MIRSLLQQGMQTLGLNVREEDLQRFDLLVEELKKWNQKVNLTNITSDEDIVVKHLIDSLVIAQQVKDGERLLDIGSGAGFPAIPLKIIRPEVKVISVDAVNKKIFFQRHIARLLELKDFEAVHARVEKMSGAFDVITSRAFSSLDLFIRLASPLLVEGGRMLAMKGPAARSELKEIEKQVDALGYKVTEILPYNLPLNKGERNLLVVKPREAA